MSSHKIIVLKFGSSVLRTVDDAPVAAHEIYRWVRDGWRVIAVVSALDGETDCLLAESQRWEKSPHAGATALLASTGELRSAALLTLALDRAGIDAQVLDVAAIGLRTRGPNTLDARPLRVSSVKLRRLLMRFSVLVLPGFLGRDAIGRTTLLGRGGSDCSALFLAHHLRARCRLIKDVDGLYEWDPQRLGPAPRRFRQLSWDEALQLDGGIVQHKAIEFAKRHQQPFEVAALFRREATYVGARNAVYCDGHPRSTPVRVTLLGLGNVGRGVFDALDRLPDLFQVVAVAVRDKTKPRGIPEKLLVDRLSDAIEVPSDIVVELIGDCGPAQRVIRRVLQQGTPVVTANKRLIAQDGAELEKLAFENGAMLRWSAAVGGAVPLLEKLEKISLENPVVAFRAVLNGTTNYVLDRWQRGESYAEALSEAQAAGFAEADPSRDISGQDAADKLALVHRQLAGEWLDPASIDRQALDAEFLRPFEFGGRPAIRQVASWTRDGNRFRVRVSLKTLPKQHPLAKLRSVENAALIRTASGTKCVLRGKGAGRWPTTEAVLADLFDVAARMKSAPPQSLPLVETPTYAEVVS